ncbi:hypothetical protein E3O42_03125 [Cryobacterium adonitolivorans]|uniref:DUF732 domain-containing protein n=1 Tax=Cryobacterium adonitolivorans TaxID=1259189 RepID=A0A4R8WBN4_9MICO|nr:hypothetical protein [Cryobacterium adonitolivorans]TFC05559.1 hypothetical protein E3O42_03125 [Cryobacterium adonitolivorans]
MRPLAPATVLLGIILISGCAASAPTPTPTPTHSATPTPTPSTETQAQLPDEQAQTEPQLVEKQTNTMVNLYSQVVCSNLTERPDLDLNAAVDKMLSTYATEGLSAQSREELAHRVLEESAAKSCPDQVERVTEGLSE